MCPELRGLDTGATQAVASNLVCGSGGLAVEESAVLTCHADVPSASALSECKGLSGHVESPALCQEAVFATQMYDDGDLSLAPTSRFHATASCPQESSHQRAALVGGQWCCRSLSKSCRVSIPSLSASSVCKTTSLSATLSGGKVIHAAAFEALDFEVSCQSDASGLDIYGITGDLIAANGVFEVCLRLLPAQSSP